MRTSRNRFRVVAGVTLGSCLLALSAPHTPAADLLTRLEIQHVDWSARHIVVARPPGLALPAGSELLLCLGVEPRAWATLAGATPQEATFEIRDTGARLEPQADLRAYLAPGDLVAALLVDWPPHAMLNLEIDSLGPAAHSVWLHGGRNLGLWTGDTCLLRIGGQPAARIDLRFVGPDMSFGAVVPLVADLRLKAGGTVALWPSPGETRTGSASSAVSFIEAVDRNPVVWVALPPSVRCPPEPHCDYLRDSSYLGYGVVTRQDDRFGYASFTPLATARSTGQASAPGTSGSQPTTAETRPAASQPATLRVGDDVLIRTTADIEQRSFAARVFETAATGLLVDAGENDGLSVDQQATVYRDGTALGRVEIRRVQATYAEVRPVPRPGEAPCEPHVGDELRFRPPPRPATALGTIATVTDKTLITVQLVAADPPLATPLAVVAGTRTIGVAVLVAADGTSAGGFILPCSVTAPPAPGMQLTLTSSE
jgi:hypothetical protein